MSNSEESSKNSKPTSTLKYKILRDFSTVASLPVLILTVTTGVDIFERFRMVGGLDALQCSVLGVGVLGLAGFTYLGHLAEKKIHQAESPHNGDKIRGLSR